MTQVKIKILADEVKSSLGTHYKGAMLERTDSPKLQMLALEEKIEYANPNQTGLFD
jgi:hypothetical protein